MSDLHRIKANVGTMIDKGATEGEIETYLASEGVAAQDLHGPRMSPEAEAMYVQLAQDPRSTAASPQGYVRAHGFDLSDADAQAFIASRSRPRARVGGAVSYRDQAPAPAPSSSPPPSTLGQISTTAGEVLDGLLPHAGRFMAGVGGAVGNTIAAGLGRNEWHPREAFTQSEQASDQDKARLEQDHPDLASGAGWAGTAASFMLPVAKLATGGSLAAHMANGALTGTGYGILSGAMNDSGDGRLANARNGGIAGGVLGGLAAPVARKVSNTVATARRNLPGVNEVLTGLENIPNRITGKPLVPATAAAHAHAERLLAREMEGTSIDTGMGTGTAPATPDSVATEVARRHALGVPAMPADVSDPLRFTAAHALQGRGTMATRAREELSARQVQSRSRVRQHVTEELGSTVDPIAEVEAIRQRAAAAAEPGYRAAYAQPVVVTPEMESVMRTPAFNDALPQAVRNIRNAGRAPNALGFHLDEQGNLSGVNTLSTEGFDQVIRAMRDGGRAAGEVNPITGRVRQTTDSVHINSRAKDLHAALADQNPAYRDVTANYADEMALQDALRRGGDVAKLSGPEIDAQRRAMPQ